MKPLFLILVFISSVDTYAQDYEMKAINDLINLEEPGWELVSEWISEAVNDVEV